MPNKLTTTVHDDRARMTAELAPEHLDTAKNWLDGAETSLNYRRVVWTESSGHSGAGRPPNIDRQLSTGNRRDAAGVHAREPRQRWIMAVRQTTSTRSNGFDILGFCLVPDAKFATGMSTPPDATVAADRVAMSTVRLQRIAGAGLVAIVLALSTLAGSTSANAQTPAPPTTKPAAKPTGSGDAGLRQRVESLEEQLVDMQVVVGTLESLAKSGSGAAQPAFRAAAGGDDPVRLQGLENQVRQLSSQVQQLSDQVRGLGGTPRRSDAGSSAQVATSASSGFGATTVTDGNDAIGSMLGSEPAPTFGGNAPPSLSDASGAGVATAALPPASDGVEPKQLYETAYGFLLQRDYAAAETAFSNFLTRFPSDSLSGNAQYWLGETHFVRGQYKAAAASFLKGYQTYAQSPKAADSLLKLAMSLDRLGQKDAACSSYAELGSKFPNAAQSLKSRAQSERQRVGCS